MKTLLVIDDDSAFCRVLCDTLAAKGFTAQAAMSAREGLAQAAQLTPEYILLDLSIAEHSGLALIPELLAIDPYTRIVMLTGYADIATAVEAIKLGAVHYLAKPVGVEEILAAFDKTDGDPNAPIGQASRSIMEAEWAHIRTALARNQGNISAAARDLKMHRRTLQRKLDKMPPAP